MSSYNNTPNTIKREPIYVANLRATSLEDLVKSKLSLFFQKQKEEQVQLNGLYRIIIEQVEKPLIELALSQNEGSQNKAARLLGISRNTLKKKIDAYGIESPKR